MKKIILLISLGLFTVVAYGQTVVYYGYDAAGNRIRRALTPQRIGLDEDSIGQEKTTYKVNVYPNPTQLQVTIEVDHLPKDSASSFKIYNLNGAALASGNISVPAQSTDFSAYPTGIYLVEILIGRDKKVWKIIKE